MIVKSLLLGIIQGLTEFLPVSSSGHLVLFRELLQIKTDNLFMEISMHFGSLLALIIYFRARILGLIGGGYNEIKERRENKTNLRFMGLVIIGMIPAVLAGLFLKEHIENAFTSVLFTGIMFLLTGGIILITKFVSRRSGKIRIKSAVIIGLMQVFALLPGISRSGITISSGILSGVSRKQAADFSFFMAMPLILGSFIMELREVSMQFEFYIITGIVSSLIASYIAILVLYKLLESEKFYRFAYYLFPLGILTIIYGIVK
ncbi:MAG: undecaprenyl-diphosphate phosphatase [candidate division WOR-3 bacterium]|nr:undecaprenyl-diphosphate phosphatase [candidate division WOR-3 bacterium]